MKLTLSFLPRIVQDSNERTPRMNVELEIEKKTSVFSNYLDNYSTVTCLLLWHQLLPKIFISHVKARSEAG